MLNIGQFFKRIQNKHTKELFVRSVIREAIQTHSGVDVPVEKMSFSNSAVILKGLSQSARSQIFIKKQAILQEIKNKQNIKVIDEIR